ncbi:hypothetical protein [Sulfuriferula thiophila]|uniref:hypothetical protein n=1 Tax=Sulfuriferula thiophila TaxID=1781211 RepID=UPI000F607E7F|nr:hypothetical protein [Sulfuriferula thiophila]
MIRAYQTTTDTNTNTNAEFVIDPLPPKASKKRTWTIAIVVAVIAGAAALMGYSFCGDRSETDDGVVTKLEPNLAVITRADGKKITWPNTEDGTGEQLKIGDKVIVFITNHSWMFVGKKLPQ